MSEKTFNTRIIHKHDVEENWLKATNFTPKQGEIIIYDIDENYPYERFKIGDGQTNINSLPFSAMQSDYNQDDPTKPDYIKNKPGVLQASVEGSCLLLTQDDFGYTAAEEVAY